MKSLTKIKMLEALKELETFLPKKVQLIIGGGGAMLLAYDFPLATADIDAVPQGLTVDEIDPLVKKVAKKLDLPSDWLNPYFSTFAIVLPPDFENRLRDVYSGPMLAVKALGPEDLLVMKCFAHRPKDIPHARALLRKGVDKKIVNRRINELVDKKYPEAQRAADFLDELLDLEYEG